MRKELKRIVSVILATCLCMLLIPNMSIKTMAATTGLTLSELREKYPHGKYWNHADNPGSDNSLNNQDGYTNIPCSQHGVIGTDKQTCNGFMPWGMQLSWQCMGYAEKLGYDATGYSPRSNSNGWYTDYSVSALDNLKAGDIVRYNNDRHSIYITGVEGDTVYFTDCNSDNHCVIRWDVVITKTALRETFSYVRVAPQAVLPGETSCGCSEEYAGIYTCNTDFYDLNIRSGHGTSYDVIGYIPKGAYVTVNSASGNGNDDWAHVTYKGISGYASMQYLKGCTGMYVYNGKWVYVTEGRYDTSYTGMARNVYGWWYIKDGNLDRTFTGMVKNAYGVWYMRKGKLDKSYTGMYIYNGKWIYVNQGRYDTSYTGMARNSYGWWYIKNGNLDRTYTGLVQNEYGWWYFKSGKLDKTYNGVIMFEGNKYMIKNGRVV